MNRRHIGFQWHAVVMAAVLGAGSTMAGAGTQKFYPDDPLTSDPENADASRVKPQDVGRSYVGWQMIRGAADHTWRRAIDVNVIDEVPDSSWFTNRIGSRPLSAEAIRRGPDRAAGPPRGRGP